MSKELGLLLCNGIRGRVVSRGKRSFSSTGYRHRHDEKNRELERERQPQPRFYGCHEIRRESAATLR